MYYHLFTPHLHEAGKYLNEWAFKRLMQEEVRKTQSAERNKNNGKGISFVAPHTEDPNRWRVVWDRFCNFGFD
jgi:hypothetical protein